MNIGVELGVVVMVVVAVVVLLYRCRAVRSWILGVRPPAERLVQSSILSANAWRAERADESEKQAISSGICSLLGRFCDRL